MQRFKAAKPVLLHSGILQITPQQIKDRTTALVTIGEGLAEILLPVQFKAGEEFGYSGDLSKEHLADGVLESLPDPNEITDEEVVEVLQAEEMTEARGALDASAAVKSEGLPEEPPADRRFFPPPPRRKR